jgi:hypothetical protein
MAPVYPPGWQGQGKPLKPNTPATTTQTITQTPTSNFNFTTAGTGQINFDFGPGMINYDMNNNWYNWSGNTIQPTPIVFIGDNLTGKYLPSTNTTLGLTPGSPMDMDEAIGKIIQEANAKPGGIEALKKLLDEKQMYANKESGSASIQQGAAFDPFFTKAVANALMSATASNAQLAASQGGKNPKILSFNQFLANVPVTGLYGTSAFGAGGTKTNVVHRKFQPEEFEIVIDQLFQQTIGRGASKEELDDFVSKLQTYEKKNPEITVSKTSGNTTTQTQSGGVSGDIMQSMMRDDALANPEAEGYNKATKYLNYFMDALDSPIELG